MRRGYIRERRVGPSIEDQRKSLASAGVMTEGTHPPIYMDMLKDVKGNKPLRQLALAVKSLRGDDEIVMHDAATPGRDHQEICDALAAVGAKGNKLVICTPTEREFVWRPEENSMLSVAGEGVTILRSEKHRNAGNKVVGAAPKLVGRTLDIARKHWADPAMTARQAHEAAVAESGVKFSSRLMWQLGKKSDAEATLTKPPPAKAAPKKAKPKRRKRKATETSRPLDNALKILLKGTAHADTEV